MTTPKFVNNKKNLEDAINDTIYYQEDELIKQLIEKANDKEDEKYDKYEISEYESEVMEISSEVFDQYLNDAEFLSAVNNETMRRYLEMKGKLTEYEKKYHEKYDKVKENNMKKRIEKLIKRNETIEVSVGDDYGYCVDSYERDAKIVVVTDEQQQFGQKKISYYKLIHEEYQ
jgi:hypothetical protein